MDPFTQRMLERARARQEKIDQKLANSGQAVPTRKPLSENVEILKNEHSPVKSPVKIVNASPKKSYKETRFESPTKSNRKSNGRQEQAVATPKSRSDVVVTRKEFRGPKRGSISRRDSDVSVEINIVHRDDIQIEVQVEERDAPMSVVYDSSDSGSGVTIKEIEEDTSSKQLDKMDLANTKSHGLRHNVKSRLDRLGNLYSDKPTLSSPIHRTELEFTSATPPTEATPKPAPAQKREGKKFGRLAALADEINNWEDDLTHHTYHPEPVSKKPAGKHTKGQKEQLESSTLDVSIHSIKDINKALQTNSSQKSKPSGTSTYGKQTCNQRLDKQIVAELEPKCASTTPSAAAAPKMATLVSAPPAVAKPAVAKKPSIKKYKAPTPPRNDTDDENCDKDKENNVVPREENDNDAADDCIQTNQEPADKPVDKGSPVVRRLAPKINGNVDRSSVLSKAAMFEASSPRAKEKDPAEMSLRERKALFEKNKGAAIIPKAPFGLAPSVKALHGDKDKPTRPAVQSPKTPTKSTTNSRTNSKDDVTDDNGSQTSLGGGIKGKLAALFNKEQTISETTIANKFKLEREREMEMLQNRFNYKPKPQSNDSDEEQSEHDPSEKAPLMGSTLSLSAANRKPEIIANVPKVTFEDKTRSETALNDKEAESNDRIVGSQPVKRRSSQDSPVVLSVLEDVKRIKVNTHKSEPNGAVLNQPASLYPHLSDIETDTSHEDYSDCGGSSEKLNDKLNKSDNWAETSFGRDVMNVVKKNNSSYQKAVRESDSDSSQNANDSELDDMLDEALNDSEGPTPPKVNKHGTVSSNSFVYKEQVQFKSPLKMQTPVQSSKLDKGNELVHSVSFYRRMQNASNPSTPMRVVRHTSPDRDIPSTPSEPSQPVTTVRERVKELQAEIAKQQTVISQASQALNLCAATVEFSGSTEQAEGERLLLLATHRRQACLHEMQRLQVEGAGPASAPGAASLHIHTLRAPLRRDYTRQLNADGAVGHYAVLLLKCRDRVLATSMQLTQPTSNVLTFPDEIRMDGLTSDFKVTVEVYLLQASKEVLSHEVKYHITGKKANSKLLTPKSKVSELKAPRVTSPAGPQAVRTPQLQLHGYCIFALPQANRKSFTLNKVPCGSPLEGTLSMDIKARVRVSPPEPYSAFLTAFDDVSGLGAWHRRWHRLQPPTLAFWKYPDDVTKKLPIGDIDLSTVISEKVIKAPRDLCARPNTIMFESSVPAGLIVPDSGSLVYVKTADGSIVKRHLLAADTTKDRDMWLDSLNKALEYVRCCNAEDE